ncbi:MAG: BBE domain-containing protein, partial [Actinomycetota bacterium]|nr:BBE domain-containing protein [Actinomycetota bacterium]
IYFAAACWPPNAPDGDRHRSWARSSWEAVRPYRTGGNYVNVQTFDEDDVRLREAYGDSFGRLAQVKAAYDPENLFRVNRNIPPAG